MKKLLLVFYLFLTVTSMAQDLASDEASRKWYLPDHTKLQFAGNIGFMSGGPGYISRNRTLETDILFGYLPQKFGGDALLSLTAKTTYSPWRVRLTDNYYFAPFSLGFYINYTFGPQFDFKWPAYYPKGYYWWATSVRPGAYLGGKLGQKIQKKKRIKGLELYYELGTYDLLLISYVQNTRYLKPGDILSLALGVKMAF